MSPIEVLPVVGALVMGLILPTLVRLVRYGRARRGPRRYALRDTLDPSDADNVHTVHVFFEPGDGTKQLLYRGPDHIEAKHFFYRKGHPGRYTYWQGTDRRGLREADR